MIESLRTIATAAPGTFHVVRAEFTYASNPGNGSFCCAQSGSADETNPIAAIARALVRLMKVSIFEIECRANFCVPLWYTDHSGASPTSVSYTHLRAHETPEHLVCR